MENQYLIGEFSNQDLAIVYEGLFLNAYIAFESFLEDLFIGLLVSGNYGLVSSRRDISPRVEIRSHRIVRETISGINTRGYTSWLPYINTKKLAKIYFTGGRPFSEITNNHSNRLDEFRYIRNAIAHNSRSSQKKFVDNVIGNRALLPNERNPAGYLRGMANAQQSRIELAMLDLLSIANYLTQ